MKSYYKLGANIHINDITMHGTFLDYCCVKSTLAWMLFWIDFEVDPRHYNEMLGYVLKVCGITTICFFLLRNLGMQICVGFPQSLIKV